MKLPDECKCTFDEINSRGGCECGALSDSSPVAGSAKFSIDEIEKWLEGWMLFDGKGDESKPRNMALSLALSLLRDEEDGIETYTKHNAQISGEKGAR